MRWMAGVLVLAMTSPAMALTMSPPPAPLGHKAERITIAGPAVLGQPLPSPDLPASASVSAYLEAAQQALGNNDVKLVKGALEMAETRALTRSVVPSRASDPDHGSLVESIEATRAAVGRGDWAGANAALAHAIELAKK